jgi:hypothetical protein
MKIKNTIDFKDELGTLAQHANRTLSEVQDMEADLKYVVPGVQQLRQAAKDFAPAPQRNEIIRTNPNIKPDDPAADLSVAEYNLRTTLTNLDKAADLIEQRRVAIRNLLASGDEAPKDGARHFL